MVQLSERNCRQWYDELRTFRYERVSSHELGMFGIIGFRAANEIFQKQEVPRTSLDYGEEPVTQLELPTAWVGLLLGDERGKLGI